MLCKSFAVSTERREKFCSPNSAGILLPKLSTVREQSNVFELKVHTQNMPDIS